MASMHSSASRPPRIETYTLLDPSQYVTDEAVRAEILRRHSVWLSKFPSLSAAIEDAQRDFSEAPIKRWYDAHAKSRAEKTTRARAYYLNSKRFPQR